MLVQVFFKAKWRLKNNPHYVWTSCKKLINTKTSSIIKKTTNGKGIKPGYYINRKFIKCEDLKKCLEIIPKEQTPFG